MAAATIHAVEQGWAGDCKRHRVILTLGTTNADTVTPASVGLKEVWAVVPTNRSGNDLNVNGVEVDSVVAITSCDYVNSSGVLNASGASKFEAFFFGK
jgi:hypothetical protein